jgi:CO/xanthine dehydrogenase FAD-binding subunit
MDLNTVSEVVQPTTRDILQHWRDGDAWLAGGTWLFSEPQPSLRRLIDLEGLRWQPLTISTAGLAIAATCTIGQLDRLATPQPWLAAPLIRQCCRSLLASFKILNSATVGGNLCMSLPAGAMISLLTALDGVCTIWQRDGGERRVPVLDFVTGVQQNVLEPGELLRGIDVPAAALHRRTSFRRLSLTHLGRSTVLLIGTRCPQSREFTLTITAATVRPLRLQWPQLPSQDQLRDRLRDTIPGDLYLDDVHGTPAYRQHLTCYFAEAIRRELSVQEDV